MIKQKTWKQDIFERCVHIEAKIDSITNALEKEPNTDQKWGGYTIHNTGRMYLC